jgi:hypothetical protein
MLAKEDRVSDLLALVCALDSGPLAEALGLVVTELRVDREAMLATGGGSAGRCDLLVRDGERPVALLEVKVGAGEHGGQFARYDAWAAGQDQPGVARLLVGLVEEPEAAPAGWRTDLTLPRLLQAWAGSGNAHAAWLAVSAAKVLEEWAHQVDGPLAGAGSPAVADLVARRVVAGVGAAAALRGLDAHARAGKTSGGTASVTAWLPFPGERGGSGSWLCVDLRAGARADPGAPWLLRLGVEVEHGDGHCRSLAQARALAHDLAVPLRPALTATGFRTALTGQGRGDLAEAVAAWPRTYDGLRGEPGPERLGKWLAAAVAGETPGAHPALFHDWGRRLASQLRLAVDGVDRHALVDLVVAALAHLDGAAGAVAPPDAPAKDRRLT